MINPVIARLAVVVSRLTVQIGMVILAGGKNGVLVLGVARYFSRNTIAHIFHGRNKLILVIQAQMGRSPSAIVRMVN